MVDDLYRTILGYAAGAMLLAGALGYCAGNAHGKRSARLEQNAHRIVVATTHREQAEKVTQTALDRSAKAEVVRAEIKQRVTVTNDSTVSIDGQLPVAVPLPIVSLLRADDRKIKMDSLSIPALQAENAALREERDAYKERVALLTPSRCGFKCGVAVGVGATVTVALLLVRFVF